MKEKPLRKSARFISILLSIGCIIFGIMSVLLFAGIMVFVCAKLFFSEIFLEAWETAIKAGQTLSFGQCIFFFICVLGEFICIFLALYNAKRIFGCISKGHSPFTNTTAIQIRKIALYVLLFAVFSVLSVFKCFHHSLCVPCLPLSCTVFLSFLIMGVSYNKR